MRTHFLEKQTPFVNSIFSGDTINMNGTPMLIAEYNLIICKRDIGLWTKLKMKPHRHWKVSEVKEYFGIKGSGENLLENFMEIFDNFKAIKKDIYEYIEENRVADGSGMSTNDLQKRK